MLCLVAMITSLAVCLDLYKKRQTGHSDPVSDIPGDEDSVPGSPPPRSCWEAINLVSCQGPKDFLRVVN